MASGVTVSILNDTSFSPLPCSLGLFFIVTCLPLGPLGPLGPRLLPHPGPSYLLSFIHSFIRYIFLECPVCAKHWR